MTTASERKSAAYAGSRPATQDEAQAALFREDPRFERLLELGRTDPQAYAKVIDPTTSIALGHYLAGKEARQRVDARDRAARRVTELEALLKDETDPVFRKALRADLETAQRKAGQA